MQVIQLQGNKFKKEAGFDSNRLTYTHKFSIPVKLKGHQYAIGLQAFILVQIIDSVP